MYYTIEERQKRRITANRTINTMTLLTTENNREQWLIEAARILTTNILMPAIIASGNGGLMPLKYAVSIGHPKGKKSIGECWKKAASEDLITSHIFITPTENSSTRILDVLLHELIHAADDCESGHKNFFAKIARKVGLVGKLTATMAGDELQEKLLDIVDAIGEIPHSALNSDLSGKKKQAARMLKVECTYCHFTYRASRTQLLQAFEGESVCPCCANDTSNAIADQLHA
jgi:hypothetical protein